MRSRKGQSGKAQVIVVILILVCVGLAALAYWLHLSQQSALSELAEKGQELSALHQSLEEKAREYNRLFTDLVGYKDTDAIQEEVSDLKGEKTLKNLIRKLRDQIAETQEQIKQLNGQTADLKAQLDKAASDKSAADALHAQEVATLQEQIKGLNEKMTTTIAEYEKKVAEANSQTTVVQTQLAEREKAFTEEKNKLESQIQALAKKIQEKDKELALLKPAPSPGPVSPGGGEPRPSSSTIMGKISAVAGYGYATIDIGKDAGITSGMIFAVCAKKNDQWVVKAKFEVKNVYRELSHGVLHDEKPEEPVTKGDWVYLIRPGEVGPVKPEEVFGSGSP